MTTRVGDLSIEELREFLRITLRELIDEVVSEKLSLLDDPDEGLELRDEVADSLRDYIKSERRGASAEDVFRELGVE